tara:strand:- start:81347 stop:81466 length:120 start_codon:yes stop_codon:yes gene_type:complete
MQKNKPWAFLFRKIKFHKNNKIEKSQYKIKHLYDRFEKN